MLVSGPAVILDFTFYRIKFPDINLAIIYLLNKIFCCSFKIEATTDDRSYSSTLCLEKQVEFF